MKLNGAENYYMWAVYMKAQMILGDTFYVLEDDYVAPVEPEESYSAGILSIAGIPAEAKAITEYKKYVSVNSKALSIIHFMIKPHIYVHIKRITNAREAWKKLKELFGEHTEAMFESALYKISSMELRDYKDLPTYLAAFQEYAAKLEQMDSPIPHKQQLAFYKRGLPQYLKDRVFTLTQYDVRNKREVRLDLITAELESRRTQTNRPSEKATETNVPRGRSGNRTANVRPGGKGTVPFRAKSHDRNDHKHDGEPCRFGAECFKKYPDKKPEWMKQMEKEKEKEKLS